MKLKKNHIFMLLLLFLIISSMANQINMENYSEPTQEDLMVRTSGLRRAGFWNNFTFIHITNLNWTTASSYDWCSGIGSWGDPYLIENMVINASGSSIDCGIFIENSVNVYFKIKNVTIYEGTNGIKLENTNKGTLVGNVLSNNVENGIYAVNCVNNTISRNQLTNNDMYGLYMSSNCLNNKIIGNIAKNDGTNLQEAGIFMQNFCDDNQIVENIIYDNNVYGINIEDSCEENLIYNNTLKNVAANQQDYGIRLDNDCHQNNISLNTIENLNNYGIIIVTSDQNVVMINQIIDVSVGMYMLWDLQSEIISNTISDCSMGITMSACSEGDIIGNFINETTNYAIRIYTNCDDNDFHDNVIKDNAGIGIQLLEPLNDNNIFYRNSFISNRVHAYDNGTANFWNNTIIGNYWDNYTGLDLDNDHIGDTPFTIHGAVNSNDSLPIVDHGPPGITINAPISNQYNATAPEFNIFVEEPFIYSMWYTLNNSGKKYYFSKNGTINLNAWSTLSDGNLTITFYARNFAWNTGSTYIDLIKKTSQGSDDPVDPGNESPPINIVFIVIISVIAIAAIAMIGILTKVLPNRRKVPELQKLDEEQLTEAQYFKDITSILTVLAMHNESGLCLSKFAIHNGNGLDEHLFTGFISAIGSFKNELAKQMGLLVGGERGDNIIEYNEFTITLMDGVYLRLGLVSYNKLGGLVKEKCSQVLKAYEDKHLNDLKNFDGEIMVFSDFEEAIEAGLELNLNKKCFVNVKRLNDYDAPEVFKTALNSFKPKIDGFYPVELANTLKQDVNVSEQEANFMVYKAYDNQIFKPI